MIIGVLFVALAIIATAVIVHCAHRTQPHAATPVESAKPRITKTECEIFDLDIEGGDSRLVAVLEAEHPA